MKADVVGGDGPVTVRVMTANAEALRTQRKRPGRDRALVLRRHDFSAATELLRALSERGLVPVVVEANGAHELPAPESLRMVVVAGADRFGAPADRAQLDAELGWLRRADRRGIPILGIGHGARALASALGGGVEQAERGHRGWALVDTSVPHMIPGGPWLAWQHDEIRLPPGAELLAHNRLGPQAFKVGRHLGVQFHPGATPRSVASWASSDGEALDFHDTLTVTARDAAAAEICARRLFSAFIDTV